MVSIRSLFLSVALLLGGAARADDPVETARTVMRQALREQAPAPSSRPMLPDRAVPTPLVPGEQLTRRQRDAEHTARAHASERDHGRADAARIDAANRAATHGTMGMSREDSGFDEHSPAEMMREMGHAPGGGTMGSRTGIPGGHATGGGAPGVQR